MPIDTHLSAAIIDYVHSDAALLVIEMTPQGIITKANTYAERVVGEPLTGRSFAGILIDFQGSFDLDACLENPSSPHLLNITSHGGLPQTFYFKFVQHDAQILALGQLDVDELDHLRHSLLSLNSELNDLTRQLEKRNVQLQQLDALKNQFFGMAAHDLRHPVGVIRMYGEFLADEAAQDLSSEHREFLHIIQTSGNLMEAILNDFIDIAVFESGKLTLNRKRVNLPEWLRRIVDYSAVLAAPKKIEIRMPSPPALPLLRIDAAKMEQVMNNLISNAIKFSQAGDTIWVKLDERQVDAGADVVLSVQDQGPGIDQGDLKRLFEPFERVRSGHRPVEKSSGLGLAIVQKIVAAHEGRVWVESEVGRGSTFFVALPLDPTSQEAADK